MPAKIDDTRPTSFAARGKGSREFWQQYIEY